ncbi:hypothetical protein ACWY4P_41140 [Streptomyces sp. LZ34]
MQTDWFKQCSGDGLVRRLDELIAEGESREQIQLMAQAAYETAARYALQPEGLADLLSGDQP